jgi:hypothetical protein
MHLTTRKQGKGKRMKLRNRAIGMLGALTLLTGSTVFAQTARPSGSGKGTITVTAIGKKDSAPPQLSKDDVQLTVNKERKQIVGWNKADGLGLAILIDDSLDTSAGEPME